MQADIKVLDRVVGEKKELYLSVLKALAEGFTEKEVGLIFNLSEGRISQIYKANKKLCDELTLEANLSNKAGRLRFAFRNLRRKDGHSQKDPLDWLEYIRKEIVGEKGIDVKVGVKVENKIGANGSFSGEDRELQNRIRSELFGGVQK